MATVSKWNPFGVALDITATSGTVVRTSATQYTVVINASWETYYEGAQTNYGMDVTSGGVTKTISSFTGAKRSNGSGSFTGTYSISDYGASKQPIAVTFRNYNSDNGDSAISKVNITVNVPAWTSYTIKFSANGGTNPPSQLNKWKDISLKLPGTKPTRPGHSFLGWSTSATATSATYSAGGTIPANVNTATTLYAVWKPNTYTVKFNANGGSGAPSDQTKTYGVALTLSTIKPKRTNYNFKGWGTSASATTVAYSAGGSYKINASITLYAIWELEYSKPYITVETVARCDADGNKIENGTYALVNFSYFCSRSPTSITIDWSTPGESGSYSYTGFSDADIGWATDASVKVGDGTLSTEKSYTITITVTDTGGTSYVRRTIHSETFLIDCLPENKGVAFGKTAGWEGYVDFGFKAKFDNNVCVYGTKPDGTVWEALNPCNASGNTVLGYDNYENKNGLTNIYGYDLNFGVSNITSPGTFRPYRRQGDSMSISLRTSGYITNSKKDLSFWIPFSVPIIGSPTVTVACVNGFQLRQGDSYICGSSATSYALPTSLEATVTMFNGVYVKAVFSNTTNVTNNDTVGIYFNGTITFS